MRSADFVSLFRIAVLFAVVYFIITLASAIAVISLLVLLFVLDAVDGFLAKKYRGAASKHGVYLDIGVDRIVEYSFWILFTYLKILPLFVVFIIVVRNSLADVLMASRKSTFSKMRTGFGKIASSHISRGLYAVLKAANFGYLALVFVANWPANIGYVLTAIVVAYSLARGAAEIYESLL